MRVRKTGRGVHRSAKRTPVMNAVSRSTLVARVPVTEKRWTGHLVGLNFADRHRKLVTGMVNSGTRVYVCHGQSVNEHVSMSLFTFETKQSLYSIKID